MIVQTLTKSTVKIFPPKNASYKDKRFARQEARNLLDHANNNHILDYNKNIKIIS